ncbi:piggyBac transposable element-derived protein 4-like [Triplophysa dalaica]|uniref:piggyBac transposable element-derived protein 4-like n=2 Tax=Triplophysa dalaica TaxID=1582913 RepID=UPI0024DF40D3|nr:piggyBac transposable element-derived protein 4-like [Triplophysa dalaica]XP_056626764.1 piggyBac transposable element-derived protein 4-like [Triplophysa dalaica]XP_056626773.1 piggyBac transposable element-derived protein 4-like [Triplophysa dalaica]XP_056626781.1 piggyBac transposable element-derived protein 4-like [Triplophysa dalaica]
MDRRPQTMYFDVESALEEIMRSSDEEQQKEAETCVSDRDSSGSSVDSLEDAMFGDGLDPVLDRPSNDTDEDWCPESSAELRKRSRQPSSSSGTTSSASPSAAAANGTGKGRTRGGRERGGRARGRRARGGRARGGRGRWSQSVHALSPSTSQEKWHNVDEDDKEPPQPVFRPARTPGPQLLFTASYTALQLFQLFFSTSVLQTLIHNTNAYGAKLNQGRDKPWHNISGEDFKSYLALVVYMGLVKVFTLTDYWRRSTIYSLPFPAQIMSCRKFLTITSALHLSDPQDDEENEERKGTSAYDRLGKIKPLYNNIRDACKTFFHPHQNISIDERMVASKARSVLKQYMKNKPTKWGYKLFVLADSLCGYTCEFFVYEGKSMQSRNGLSYDSVMALVDEKRLGAGYKLYVDNFYTSPILFRDLLSKKIWACGTIRPNRIGFPKTIRNRLPRNASRGSIRWLREDELLFVEWKDTREVLMCSTFHKAYEGDTVKRRVKANDGQWSQVHVPIPGAVLDYNRFMGGVDLSDALIGYYKVLHKTRKWYRTFFYHFVDIAVVNAFILHQHLARARNEKPLTQKAFRETLVLELAGLKSRTAAPQTSDVGRHNPKHITDDTTSGRRKCRLCHQKTPVMCATCEVPLCFLPKRDCFNDWHVQTGKY